jgi:hypothetical protein
MQEPNPYEPPAEHSGTPNLKSGRAKIWTVVVLGLVSIPATGLACFTSCLMVAMLGEGRFPSEWSRSLEFGLLTGALAGLLVLGFFGYRIMKIYRRPEISTPETCAEAITKEED